MQHYLVHSEGTQPSTPQRWPSQVWLEPWSKPDALQGCDPRSLYAERIWLPLLGPSALWLARLFAWKLDAYPDGTWLDLEETANGLGLSYRAAGPSSMSRTLARCLQFAVIERRALNCVAARRQLPLASTKHLAHLPAATRAEHPTLLSPACLRAPLEHARILPTHI
jgi:hypothetical protein